MTDLATLQSRLADAEAQLHKLLTGRQLVEIRHGQSEVMRFTPAEIGALRAYISDLKGQIAKLLGVAPTGGRGYRRRVYF